MIVERDRELVAVAVALAFLVAEGGAAPSAGESDPDGSTAPLDYDAMVAELRHLMRELLPEGTEALVVSRGDDRLVAVDGLRVRHFPADAVGRWAGHHPALGTAAELLHAQRGAAEAVVVPASSSWWFDTYPEFRELLSRGRLVVDAAEVGCIWLLPVAPERSTRPAAHDGAGSDHAGAVRHLRELVAVLVEPDDVVAVISRGDPALVDDLPVTARHFPGDVDGDYIGHPRDDRHALALLDAAMACGACWLIIPADADWWADHYPRLWARAHREPSLITRRPGVGTVVRLESSP